MMERQVGWGYFIGFFAFFTAAVAALVSGVRAKDEAGRFGALGLFIAAIGGGFLFGTIYTMVRGLGINWVLNSDTRPAWGILTRDSNPLLYWGLLAGIVALACGLVGLGLWMWMNA